MKKVLRTPFILFTFLLLTANQCVRQPHGPNDPLPPATQEGKEIFACYVNGNAFIATPYNCFYQYDYEDGRHYLSIRGDDKTYFNDTSLPWSINLGSNIDIQEDMTLRLSKWIEGQDSAHGCIFLTAKNGDGVGNCTDENLTGEMHITKFDLQNRIISGTFWFDVINPLTGDTLEIRDGRFDVHFAR